MALPSFVQSRESLVGVILVIAVVTLAIVFGGATLGIPAAGIGLLFIMYLFQPNDDEKNPKIQIFSGKPRYTPEEAALLRADTATKVEADRRETMRQMDETLQRVRDAELAKQEEKNRKQNEAEEAQQARQLADMEMKNRRLTMALNNQLLQTELHNARQVTANVALGAPSEKKKPRRNSAPLPGEKVPTTSKPGTPQPTFGSTFPNQNQQFGTGFPFK